MRTIGRCPSILTKRERIDALVAIGLLLPGSLFIGHQAGLIRLLFLEQDAIMLTVPTLIFLAIPVVFLIFVVYAAIS